jgi:hypothetical protein
MSAKRERAGSLLASGTFWLGLGLILTAPIMNMGYERLFAARLSGDGAERMPEFLATLYNKHGQTGVTLSLIAIGTGILIFGNMRLRPKRQALEGGQALTSALRDTSVDDPNQVATGSGHMVLKTRKYLT